MKCYNHQTDAVGICKSCNKGICKDCAVDVGDGIACHNSCEQSVKILNELVSESKQALLRTKSVFLRTRTIFFKQALLIGLLGVFFIVFGLLNERSMASFVVPVGGVFLIWMLISIVNGLKIKK